MGEGMDMKHIGESNFDTHLKESNYAEELRVKSEMKMIRSLIIDIR